jgi:hypothetical protein
MSITVQLDLPETIAAEAKAKGLLDPQKLTQLVEREVQFDKPLQDYREMVEQMVVVLGRQSPGEKQGGH